MVWLMLSGSLLSHAVWAFEGKEHRAVSRVGLRLACLSVGLGEDCGPLRALAAVGEGAAPRDCDQEESNWKPTFDDFAVWVDFIDDPEKLLHPAPGRKQVGASPASPMELDLDFLCRLPRRPTAKLHAAHNNSGHFQEHLLHSMRTWHQAAIDEARASGGGASPGEDRREMYTALIKMAIASHFLEDFFAPGHIAAPREAYPDYPANTLHDRHNSRGRAFRLTNEVAVRFEVFGRVLHDRVSQASGAQEANLLRELGLEEEEALHYLQVELQAGHVVLLRGDGDLLSPSSFGVDANRAIGNQASEDWNNDAVDRACADPACTRESRIQRALVTFTVADAIRRVLMAGGFGGGEQQSGVLAYEWRRMRDAAPAERTFSRKVFLAAASIPVGEYLQEGPTRMRYGFMGLLEVCASTFLEGADEGGRGAIGAEWIPGLAPPGHRVGEQYVPKFVQYALALGGSYRIEEDLGGPELTFREYIILPRLDMHFSIGARLSSFDHNGNRTTRLVPEARFGKSYGFLGLFVGASRDVQLRPGGELGQVWGMQGGVQFALPWWRIAREVAPEWRRN